MAIKGDLFVNTPQVLLVDLAQALKELTTLMEIKVTNQTWRKVTTKPCVHVKK
jgi:hypothetical protein